MEKAKFVLIPLIAYIISFLFGITLKGVDIMEKIGEIKKEEMIYSVESFDIDTNKEDTIEQEAIVFKTNTIINPSEDVINILLVGKDVKDGEPDTGRTDSMMIASLNRKEKKASLISLMRDCYVQIPGYSNNKLNAAYSIGGYALLDETIEQNFGIKIDYNIGVNFTSFTTVIDKIGGIDLELSEDEASYILKKTKQESGLYEGINHLTGKQALWYARTRYVSTKTESNDFGRTSRQRIVIQKTYEKIKGLGIDNIIDIIQEVASNIETDMSVTDIIALGTEAYNMDISSLESHRIPDGGEYTDEIINRMMVLVINFDKAQEHLKEWLY